MSIDWKPVGVSALLAFIIAVVSAGLSGIPFGVLLFRAVVGALIFGAGAAGVQLLIRRFLPELQEEQSDTEEARGTVDIVISDDEDSLENGDEDAGFEPGLAFDTAESEETDGEPLVEEVEEADTPPSTSEEEDVEELAEADTSTVDTLPDVGAFTDSFMADTAIETAESSTGKGSGEGQDPEAIAKAIRTLMKREES